MSKPVITVATFGTADKRQAVNHIINKQNGKFFTANVNTKTSNRNISINCRTGVHKFLRGNGVATGGPDIKTVFNVKKMEYRKVFIDGVQEIRANGVIYRFI